MAAKLHFSDIVKTGDDTNPYPLDRLKAVQPKRKALVIDDESDICYLLSGILKKKDIQVVTAGSLAEAERMLSSVNGFYYIFLDNHLPDGLGMDHIRHLKKQHPEAKLIMITAHASGEDKQKAETDGVDYFIHKPFSSELIYRTL